MQKIIISLSIIAAVAAVTVGATTAFFSDTETSTGNTFTAGGIDLTVDSFGAARNGVGIPNAPWFARDLTAEKFFDFIDVKPGDWFDRSISLHVENNPAWICLRVKNVKDNENTLTDPEIEANDATPGENGTDGGELAKTIHALGWTDRNADGKLQPGETRFVDSFFDVFTEIALHDSTTGNGPLSPAVPVELLQLSLCAGNHTISPLGVVSCDGAGVGNQSQTDSLHADMELYAEQERNNPDFHCVRQED